MDYSEFALNGTKRKDDYSEFALKPQPAQNILSQLKVPVNPASSTGVNISSQPTPENTFLNRRKTDVLAAGESLLNTLKALGNLAEKNASAIPNIRYSKETGYSAVPNVSAPPFQLNNEQAKLAEEQRGKQGIAENVLSGIIGLAPYINPYGGYLFGTQMAAQPEKIPEMAKSSVQSMGDILRVLGPARGLTKILEPEETKQAEQRFENQPVETLVGGGLPVAAILGLGSKLGKAKAKVGFNPEEFRPVEPVPSTGKVLGGKVIKEMVESPEQTAQRIAAENGLEYAGKFPGSKTQPETYLFTNLKSTNPSTVNIKANELDVSFIKQRLAEKETPSATGLQGKPMAAIPGPIPGEVGKTPTIATEAPLIPGPQLKYSDLLRQKLASESSYPVSLAVVENEIKQGRTIPPDVLKQFPELLAKYPELKKPIAGEIIEKAKVFNVPIKDVITDADKFQNRLTPFSEKTAEAVAERFDPNKFDPIVLWNDPNTGKNVILSGHSRFEGMKRRGANEIPARYFEGTEEQALKFAKIEGNRLASSEGIIETINAYKQAKKSNYTKKQLIDHFDGDVELFESLQHLNPKGEWIRYLGQESSEGFPYLKRFSRWVGELRKIYSDKLTNFHETQLFDYVYRDERKNMDMLKDDFFNLVQKQIDDFAFDPNKPLVLKRGEVKTGFRARQDTGWIMEKIDGLKEQKEKAKTIQEVQALDAEIVKLRLGLTEIDKKQTSIFGGEPAKPVIGEKMVMPGLKEKMPEKGKPSEVIRPIEERGAGFNPLKPFGSKEQQLARALKKAEAENKLPSPPTVTMDIRPADARPIIQHPSHKYGAIPDEFGEIHPKYGEVAAKAQQKLMTTEIQTRIDQGAGQRELKQILSPISKHDVKLHQEKMIEYLEKPIEELPQSGLPDKVKKVVADLKAKSDRERKEIVEIKRSDIRKAMNTVAEQRYRMENDLKGKRLDETQRAEIKRRAEDMVATEVPDTWGIKDYFRHLHLGDFTILRDGKYIGAAKSWTDALPKIAEDYALNPEGGINYSMKLREFHNPDVVRVSRGRQYKIINDLAKEFEAESGERIQDILRGKIGSREGRRKWAGFLQERKGAPGYSKDLLFVLNYHNRMYNRWKNLYKLQSEIQPMITKIRKEGREFVAKEIEANLNELWGRSQSYKGQYQVARWAGRIRNVMTTVMLKTSLRYNLMNSLQLAQTGMVVPYKSILWAQKAVRSAEGKALLDQHGVYDVIVGTGGELVRNITTPEFRSSKTARMLRLSPETSNQAEMWLATYHHGKNLGMDDAAAAKYGFLRGMVYSQFLPLRTNQPALMRNQLFRTTAGMYKNFVIHAFELGGDLGKKTFRKDVPISIRTANGVRFAHFITAQLALGGTRLLTSFPAKVGIGGYLTYKVYNEVKKDYGEDIADILAFGLPSLINSDWSASVQMIDLPYAENIPEAIGQMVLGPVGTIPLQIWKKAQVETGPEDEKWKQITRAFLESFGGTRQILGFEKVMNDDYDFKSPDGKKRFEGDLKDALVQMYGSRPITAAVESMKFDALTEVMGERNAAINAAVKGDKKLVLDFNAKWGAELAISFKEVVERKKGRARDIGKTSFERSPAPKKVKGYFKRMVNNTNDK